MSNFLQAWWHPRKFLAKNSKNWSLGLRSNSYKKNWEPKQDKFQSQKIRYRPDKLQARQVAGQISNRPDTLQDRLWTGPDKLQARLWTGYIKLQAILRFKLDKLQAIEPIHIFYKEKPVDENNIFTANRAEEIEIEEVRFKKSKEYAVTALSINQGIDSRLVAVTDADWQEAISNLIQKLLKDKKRSRYWP